MAVPSPWPVTNLAMYSTLLICAVKFSIGNGVELAKISLLIKFNANFVYLVA